MEGPHSNVKAGWTPINSADINVVGLEVNSDLLHGRRVDQKELLILGGSTSRNNLIHFERTPGHVGKGFNRYFWAVGFPRVGRVNPLAQDNTRAIRTELNQFDVVDFK